MKTHHLDPVSLREPLLVALVDYRNRSTGLVRIDIRTDADGIEAPWLVHAGGRTRLYGTQASATMLACAMSKTP